MRRVVVVGDGGWGTALSLTLLQQGVDVGLWSVDPDYAAIMRAERGNPRYLPGYELPGSLQIDNDLGKLITGTELLVSAVPTSFLREVWSRHLPLLPAGIPILSVSKGLEQDTLLRPTEVLADVAQGAHPIFVLSGPNIAREIAAGQPAATVVAGPDEDEVRRIQATFSGDALRVYSNPDAVGVELGGVLKNVIALAAGMCDGMDLGVNAKASLVSRGLIEMSRLGEALGGERKTFFGLSGLGDLMTTCYSQDSRNRTFGERLGGGERIEDIAASMQQVAEGVKSAGPLHELMQTHGLQGPITEEVYRVVGEGKSPRDVVRSLMRRTVKNEAEDL